MKKFISQIILVLFLVANYNCKDQKSVSTRQFRFNAVTFETLEGNHKFEGEDLPTVDCNSTFRFIGDSLIDVKLVFEKTKSMATSVYTWYNKYDIDEDGRLGTVYKLRSNESGFGILCVRRDAKGNILAVSMTDSLRKTVYLNK